MSFLDWTTTESNPTSLIIHEFIGHRRLPTDSNGNELDQFSLDAPITGTGSLAWHFTLSAIGTIRRTADAGTNSGYLRTRWNVQLGGAGSPQYGFGMYCFASQANLTGGVGNCYFVSIQEIDLERRVAIYKSSVGVGGALDIPPLILLGSMTAAGQWARTTTFSTEFRWFFTGTSVKLKYSQGTLENYTDLNTVLDVEDTSPLTASVGQGFWAENVTSQLTTLFMDNTRGKNAVEDWV